LDQNNYIKCLNVDDDAAKSFNFLTFHFRSHRW